MTPVPHWFERLQARLMIRIGLAATAVVCMLGTAGAMPLGRTTTPHDRGTLVLVKDAPSPKGQSDDDAPKPKHSGPEKKQADHKHKPDQKYKAGHKYEKAPKGWKKHGKRPDDWKHRGCIIVGPVWFCP